MRAGRASVFRLHDRADSADQPYKFGLWATPNLRVASWQLEPGQRIVAHAHDGADDVMVVLAGEGHFITYDGTEPDGRTVYTPLPDAVVVPPANGADNGCLMVPVSAGHVAVTPAGVFHGLVNTGGDRMLVVVATGPETGGSRYVVR